MSPFDEAPEFIAEDNRRLRSFNPISKEQMHNKHDALFPEPLLKNLRILDLGCGIGATGHWCLSYGASHYTGVEVQNAYSTVALRLLEKYHPQRSTIIEQTVEDFLQQDTNTYDIVSLLACLHTCTDYYSILRNACAKARRYVLIEELRPVLSSAVKEFCGVQFMENASINLATENASLAGRGIHISPLGLIFIMREFGFSSEGELPIQPIRGTKDAYSEPLSPRYLMRFERRGQSIQNLSNNLRDNRTDKKRVW